MGELHLEIIADRLLREFNVGANVGKPQVSYRETIKQKAVAEGKYIKQTGGRGQYGHCIIEVEPKERVLDTPLKTKLLVVLYLKNTSQL